MPFRVCGMAFFSAVAIATGPDQGSLPG